ncbi:PH domain-containing protein [Aeromicrobium sp. CTD01-1L150]|uniref:PH domain-containing protein n=1 Tax=Aeromicrobium sp. CTD01-1L150 TaxID=3341830 RepID=UPI0035C155B6
MTQHEDAGVPAVVAADDGPFPGESGPRENGPDEASTEATSTEETGPRDVGLVEERDAPLDADAPWHRLSGRMIVVDVVRTLLSIAPSLIAFGLLDVRLTWGTGGPLLGLAVIGAVGAGHDALRWVTTRYRLTEEHLERSTGLFVRRYRSIRRERIRSVDTDARLRHRVAGLRVVLVGAGQQSAASESALALDAIVRADAVMLRDRLLGHDVAAEEARDRPEDSVFARFQLWWIVYNVVGVWAFLMAAGLVGGGGAFLSAFGVNAFGWAGDLLGWGSLDWVARIGLLVVLLAAVGVLGLGVNYVTAYWNFELARVPGGGAGPRAAESTAGGAGPRAAESAAGGAGPRAAESAGGGAGPVADGAPEMSTQLRTRHGLFRTREVNRDDRRLRGVMISEPVLWRWMRLTDTEVITTGLSIWSPNQPASILPRTPRSVARDVASRVLQTDPDPVAAAVHRQPARALRRRLVWATVAVAVALATLAYVVVLTSLPGWTLWTALGLWPIALGAAVVAYRALGYAVVGTYAVVRSGLVSRRTAILQRKAVSTIIVRESVLQRRLGLRTVMLATAAGWGAYAATDLDAADAVEFATQAAPGLLDPYVEGSDAPRGSDIVES